jgi:hypothetical protein
MFYLPITDLASDTPHAPGELRPQDTLRRGLAAEGVMLAVQGRHSGSFGVIEKPGRGKATRPAE